MAPSTIEVSDKWNATYHDNIKNDACLEVRMDYVKDHDVEFGPNGALELDLVPYTYEQYCLGKRFKMIEKSKYESLFVFSYVKNNLFSFEQFFLQ